MGWDRGAVAGGKAPSLVQEIPPTGPLRSQGCQTREVQPVLEIKSAPCPVCKARRFKPLSSLKPRRLLEQASSVIQWH